MRGWSREQMAWLVAQDLWDGACVNLGIGMPTLVANYVSPNQDVLFHSENGVLGVGSRPSQGEDDYDLINVNGDPVTLTPGGAFLSHADGFALVRGGHLDVAVLGAYQVSQRGDLANWMTLSQSVPSIGGAMDIAVGAKQVFVMMEHTTRSGEPKILHQCTYPLTALEVVTRMYTNLCVIDVAKHGLYVTGIAEGVSMEDLQRRTEPTLLAAENLKTLYVPNLASESVG